MQCRIEISEHVFRFRAVGENVELKPGDPAVAFIEGLIQLLHRLFIFSLFHELYAGEPKLLRLPVCAGGERQGEKQK